MPELTIPQSLNKAYRQLKIEKIEFDRFKRVCAIFLCRSMKMKSKRN